MKRAVPDATAMPGAMKAVWPTRAIAGAVWACTWAGVGGRTHNEWDGRVDCCGVWLDEGDEQVCGGKDTGSLEKIRRISVYYFISHQPAPDSRCVRCELGERREIELKLNELKVPVSGGRQSGANEPWERSVQCIDAHGVRMAGSRRGQPSTSPRDGDLDLPTMRLPTSGFLLPTSYVGHQVMKTSSASA